MPVSALCILALLLAGPAFCPAPLAAAPDEPEVSSDQYLEPPVVSEDGLSEDIVVPSEVQGFGRREVLLASLTVFVLAVFLGFELITKVPPTLHTPLMSGSNAISGITLVGAILSTGIKTQNGWIPLLGMVAVVMATINAVGGFAVTHRMLGMFRRK